MRGGWRWAVLGPAPEDPEQRDWLPGGVYSCSDSIVLCWTGARLASGIFPAETASPFPVLIRRQFQETFRMEGTHIHDIGFPFHHQLRQG